MVNFGKKLKAEQVEEWKVYYINYKLMKKKVKQYVQQNRISGKDHQQVLKEFSRMLDDEIEKVVLFILEEQGRLASQIQELESQRDAILETSDDSLRIGSRIWNHEETNGRKFSKEWFTDVMAPQPPPPSLENKWERTQVIGLGSVLITTVTFAAAFTIPGGYNQDHGTPVLGKRYMFWAFILANALAFIQGFLSLFALLINAMPYIDIDTFEFATITFLFAASSMVVAFGLGLYVTLAPVCLPIAIILLVITLFIGSPALLYGFLRPGEKYLTIVTEKWSSLAEYVSNSYLRRYFSRWSFLAISAYFVVVVGIYAVSILFIFCLALLSL